MKSNIQSSYLGRSLVVALLCTLFLVGCKREQELLFDTPGNTRQLDRLESFEKTVLAHTNGWEMTYVVPKKEIGGEYTVQMVFGENKTVTMWADYLDAPVTSSYALSLYQGPVVSFDTPGALTELANPANTATPGTEPGDGFLGENDFVIENVTSNVITLSGLKYGKTIELKPLAAPANLTNDGVAKLFRTAANRMTKFGKNIGLVVNGEALNKVKFDVPQLKRFISSVDRPKFGMTLEPLNEGENTTEYVVTPTEAGFTLEPALVAGGKSYTEFVYDEAGKRFSAKENAEVYINLLTVAQLTADLLFPGGRYVEYGFWVHNDNISDALWNDAVSKINEKLPGFVELELWNGSSGVYAFTIFCDTNGPAEGGGVWHNLPCKIEPVDDENGIYRLKMTKNPSQPLLGVLVEQGSNGVKTLLAYFTSLGGESATVKLEQLEPEVIKVTSTVKPEYWFILYGFNY